MDACSLDGYKFDRLSM